LTDLTKPQKSAQSKVKSNTPEFAVRSKSQPGVKNEDFEISNTENIIVTDYIKAWSYGSGDDIADVISLK